MGLFVNKSLHPTVFKNGERLEESNQTNFKIDPLSEWIEEQKTMTSTIEDTLKDLDKSFGKIKSIQKNKWNSVDHQLQGLREHYNHHEDFEEKVLESLKGLEEKNAGLRGMLKSEEKLSKEFIVQMSRFHNSSF